MKTIISILGVCSFCFYLLISFAPFVVGMAAILTLIINPTAFDKF
jgi:hypothetical protein